MSTTTLDASSPSAYGSSETALLLLDWYTLFIEKVAGPSAEPALKVAVELRNWAKTHNITVVHCLIDANGTPFPACKGVDRFQGLLEIMKNLEQPEPAELRADDKDELTFHREKGIKSLVLSGLSTSGCVLRTAVTATDAEFATTVISDACADGDGGASPGYLG
ncbi:Isochorismatase-like superfamily [Fusarium oxysporum f. sp. vasinfectum]|nr:Isochorismatase-like superfamily [Fusarium oxysporum f. sp. vasinfectum]